ncbi:MAG TPA: tetratricopeptide repeat protein [Vicinamibacterales bacterium]|nr:tetratricopeptide repeat protein [Vicinamibacterales bacterium]
MGFAPTRPRVRPLCLLPAFFAVALLAPGAANAQRQPFIDHLITFRTLLFAPYGDEGERVLAALEQLTGALAAWNDSARAQEKKLRGTDASGLVLLLLDVGRFSDALAEIDNASTAAAPGQSQLQALRGRLLEAQGRDADAAGAYRRAWELDRTDAMKAYLASVSEAVPDAGEPGPLMALMTAQRQRATLSVDRPAAALIRDLRLIPDRASKTPVFAPAAYADGFEAIAAGNYVQGLARLRSATSRDRLITDRASHSQAMSLGIARLRAGMLSEAITPLEVAASTYRDSGEANRILGTAYAAAGNDARAVEHLRRAVQLAPDDERSRLALARVLRDAGRLDEAVQFLHETIAVLPRSAEARWMLGDVLDKAGKAVDAAREMEAAGAATVIAGKSALLLRAAAIYDRHQEFDRLVDLLAQRVRLDPNDPVPHRQLGLALARLGRSDRALAELAMSDLLGGADAESLTVIGQIHLEAGRLQDAEWASRRAVTLQPESHEARYVLGHALLRQGRSDEAREQLEAFQRLRDRAIENQRRRFEIDTLRAEAASAAAAGRHHDAAAVWKRIVERTPRDPDFHMAAAEALAASGDLEDAVEYFEKAVQLGAAPAVHRRLADIYDRLGRTQESARARRTYEERVKELLKVSPPAHP